MRKIFCIMTAFLIFTFSASAQTRHLEINDAYASITFPQGFDALSRDNLSENTQLLEKTGYNANVYLKIMKNEYLYATAFSNDMNTEIDLQIYETDDSQKAFDMQELSKEELDGYKNSIMADTEYTVKSVDFYSSQNALFAKTLRSDGKQENITYSTIKNGVYYTITLQKRDKSKISQEDYVAAQYAVDNLVFTTILDNPNKQSTAKTVTTIILIGLLCVVSFAIMVVVLKRVNGWNKKGIKTLKKK